ncbi:MAG: hypothetical protein HYX67_14655 [Candidatus Melainabacteria bacterium]|nr:hypothetical protein [Candidatus Melainabacteria bacterium]
MRKAVFAVLAFSIGCYYLSSFCTQQTDGFSVARVHSDLSYNPAWETTPPSSLDQEEMERAFAQKFHYLGCGGQCFAFASEDGKYVIKLFKHRICKPFSLYLFSRLFPPFEKTRQIKLEKAIYKTNRDFTSYKIAYETLREETGLLCVHLNKSHDLKRSVTIVDKLKIAHEIDLDKVEFVLQKKAELAHECFNTWIQSNDIASVKEGVHAMLATIVSRCRKGVFDEDPRIHRNFGFIGKQPVFIDVGRFTSDERRKDPEVYKQDLVQIIKRFRLWLNDSYAPLVPILDEELYALQKT